MTSNNPEQSSCCKAPIMPGGDVRTGFYVCTKCKRACDPYNPEQNNMGQFIDMLKQDFPEYEFTDVSDTEQNKSECSCSKRSNGPRPYPCDTCYKKFYKPEPPEPTNKLREEFEKKFPDLFVEEWTDGSYSYLLATDDVFEFVRSKLSQARQEAIQEVVTILEIYGDSETQYRNRILFELIKNLNS